MVRKRKGRTIEGSSIEEEKGSMNIYDPKQREEMLKDDEITAAESGFMAGRELVGKKKKKSEPWLESKYHHDTKSTQQSQEEYQDD
ncbi:hypothetical protein [[Eubacterium] cellulosolvens]